MICNRSREERDLPDDTANHNGIPTTKDIREETRNQGTQPGTSGHSSSDTTLSQRFWARALGIIVERRTPGTLVEITFVGVGTQDGRHRRDIETKEGTADDGDGGNYIDVADDHGEN